MVKTYNAEGDLVELETGGKRKARRLHDYGVMDDEIRSDDGNSRACNAAKNAARNTGIPFTREEDSAQRVPVMPASSVPAQPSAVPVEPHQTTMPGPSIFEGPCLQGAGPFNSPPAPGSLRAIAQAPPTTGQLCIDMRAVNWFLSWDKWELFVGLWFQHSGHHPGDVAGRCEGLGVLGAPGWELDLQKADKLKRGEHVDRWEVPADARSEQEIRQIDANVAQNNFWRVAFVDAVRRWARKEAPQLENSHVQAVLEKAGWCRPVMTLNWVTMAEIKAMEDGAEKDRKLAQAFKESPLWAQRCMDEHLCGSRSAKRKVDDREDGEEYCVLRTDGVGGRREVLDHAGTERLRKRNKMDFGLTGRPTQFHAVPVEERAVDRNGKKLPYALEWPDGHPKARGQRRHAEEKGPFGKSLRRKGSSRATRTTTPAKKENPALDGFEQAWRHDQKKAAEAKQQAITSGSQGDGTSAHRPPSVQKEPTQVMLYGFLESSQPDAIKFYETVSGGIVCEDYERDPPPKIPNTFSLSASYPARALTPAETQLAKQYRGGKHWIKITFDSADAAERAIEASPHVIAGHYVYAQVFRGVGPDVDEPLSQPKADSQTRSLGAFHRPSQTIGPSFSQRTNIGSRNATTLPRSFITGTIPQSADHDSNGIISQSPSTASSATATGPDHANLRNRHQPQTEENRSSTLTQQDSPATPRPQTYTYFPDMPRTVIRPASEAFLPHPTWSESMMQRLVNAGWIPGDFIGDGVPRLQNGDFDHANASFYWRFMHWIDSLFGTDLCGIKD